MAETTAKAQGRRKEVLGEVVASRMQKTIVVQVTRKKSHPFYGRVIARHKKFYAHDDGQAGNRALERNSLYRQLGTGDRKLIL